MQRRRGRRGGRTMRRRSSPQHGATVDGRGRPPGRAPRRVNPRGPAPHRVNPRDKRPGQGLPVAGSSGARPSHCASEPGAIAWARIADSQNDRSEPDRRGRQCRHPGGGRQRHHLHRCRVADPGAAPPAEGGPDLGTRTAADRVARHRPGRARRRPGILARLAGRASSAAGGALPDRTRRGRQDAAGDRTLRARCHRRLDSRLRHPGRVAALP